MPTIDPNRTPEEHRQSVLDKLENFLWVVAENVELQEDTTAKRALITFVANLGRQVELMSHANNDEAFAEASRFIHETLQEEIFDHVKGYQNI